MWHWEFGFTVAVLAGVFALAGLPAAILAVSALSRLRARSRELEASLVALRRELAGVSLALARSDLRQQCLELHGVQLSERIVIVEARAAAPSLDRAIDSARHGAEPEKLAHEFGLSRGEADLVAKLHGQRKRA
jgi:hypothetical protein